MPPLTAAQVRVHVDRRQLGARLTLSPDGATDFQPGDLETLMQILTQDEHLVDLDTAAIEAWVQAGAFEKPLLVAEGVAPVDGADGRIDFVYQRVAEERAKARADVDQVDYKEWGGVDTVMPDEVLACVFPPEAGTPGRGVTGEELPAKSGRTVSLIVGKNVDLKDTEGVMTATSTIEGLVSVLGRKIEVSPVYVVNGDVNLSVGNVHFNGDVVITGEVREGFVVEATGNIEVQKNVDKGGLEAGGDVTVIGTIYGKDDVWVRAEGTIHAAAAENANLEAAGSVKIKGGLMQSHVIADRAYLGHETGGFVRGGVVETTGDIYVGTIGSPGSTGQAHFEIKWPKNLIQNMVKFKEEREHLTNDRGEVERQLLHLRRMEEQGRQLTVAQAERLKEHEQEAHRTRERETVLQFERDELGEHIEKCRESAITVYGDLYPDVTLVIHGKSMTVHEERGAVRVECGKDRLHTKAPQPAE